MPTTILVDVQLQRTDAEERDASLHELRQLIETLGWEIAEAHSENVDRLMRPHSSGRENLKN